MQSVENFISENLTEKYKKLPWLKASLAIWLQKLNPSQAELSALFGVLRALAKKNARG